MMKMINKNIDKFYIGDTVSFKTDNLSRRKGFVYRDFHYLKEIKGDDTRISHLDYSQISVSYRHLGKFVYYNIIRLRNLKGVCYTKHLLIEHNNELKTLITTRN